MVNARRTRSLSCLTLFESWRLPGAQYASEPGELTTALSHDENIINIVLGPDLQNVTIYRKIIVSFS